jgi:hypothetical protein
VSSSVPLSFGVVDFLTDGVFVDDFGCFGGPPAITSQVSSGVPLSFGVVDFLTDGLSFGVVDFLTDGVVLVDCFDLDLVIIMVLL